LWNRLHCLFHADFNHDFLHMNTPFTFGPLIYDGFGCFSLDFTTLELNRKIPNIFRICAQQTYTKLQGNLSSESPYHTSAMHDMRIGYNIICSKLEKGSQNCKTVTLATLSSSHIVHHLLASCYNQFIHHISRIYSFTCSNKNSSGDEIANVNFLRRHRTRTCRSKRLRPLNRLPNFYYN